MRTPVEILLTVSKIGGRLSSAGDKLRMCLPADCPPGLKDVIRQQKFELLKLVSAAFLIVESRVLSEIVFFVADQETKQVLVASGVEAGNIYTKTELQMLVDRRVSQAELSLIHRAKQRFNGTAAT
jgi:hypothetical protein